MILSNINLVFLMLTILNIKSWGRCAPGYVFRVTWRQLVVLWIRASIIDPSISRDSSSIDVRSGVMAASVYVRSEVVRATSPTPLSSGAVVLVSCMEQTGQET